MTLTFIAFIFGTILLVISLPSAPQSDAKSPKTGNKPQELGTQWQYTEGNGWSGTWLRAEEDDTFVVQLSNSKSHESASLKAKIISFQSGTVQIHRYDQNPDGYCTYTGTIAANEKSISGSAIRPGDGNMLWRGEMTK